MTDRAECDASGAWVAMDIAKKSHVVLVESPSGRRGSYRVRRQLEEIDRFVEFLHAQEQPIDIGFQPTGNYHRTLAYRLAQEGFELHLISSVACARYREARFNSWDKNDPKDAAVILALTKQGLTLRYYDPLVAGMHDLQETSKTYHQIALSRTRLQHSLLTHGLPLYFPAMDRYWRATRSEWFICFLLQFSVPAAVRALDRKTYVAEAWNVVGRKVHALATRSIWVREDIIWAPGFSIWIEDRRYCTIESDMDETDEGVEYHMIETSIRETPMGTPSIRTEWETLHVPFHSMVELQFSTVPLSRIDILEHRDTCKQDSVHYDRALIFTRENGYRFSHATRMDLTGGLEYSDKEPIVDELLSEFILRLSISNRDTA